MYEPSEQSDAASKSNAINDGESQHDNARVSSLADVVDTVWSQHASE